MAMMTTSLGALTSTFAKSCSLTSASMLAAFQARRNIMAGSMVDVVDNSGALKAKVIRVQKYVATNKGKAGLGDKVTASVRQSNLKSSTRIPKGTVIHGVVVETRAHTRRLDGSRVRTGRNSIVLVKKDGSPMGTRVNAVVPVELRAKNKHGLRICNIADKLM